MHNVAAVFASMTTLLFGLSGFMLARVGYYTATQNQFALVEFGVFMEVAGAAIFFFWLWKVAQALAGQPRR